MRTRKVSPSEVSGGFEASGGSQAPVVAVPFANPVNLNRHGSFGEKHLEVTHIFEHVRYGCRTLITCGTDTSDGTH